MKKKIIWSSIIGLTVLGIIDKYCFEKEKEEIFIIGADGTKYDSYESACKALDFQAAHDWINKFGRYDEQAKEDVFNSEMLYLFSLHSEEASERIVYLLKEFAVPAFRINPGATIKGYRAFWDTRDYINAISQYNNRCNNVIDLAISHGDYKLANKVISLMKQNVDVAFQDSEEYIIEISSKGVNDNDINVAKQKLMEAMGGSLLIDEDDGTDSTSVDSSDVE